MNDLSQKINQVLSDPEQMSKIMEMAKQFGGSEQSESQPQPAPQPLPIAPEQLQKIISLMNHSGGKEESLLKALEPFLSADKAHKMAKAVQAAKMSKIISQAFKQQHAD